MDTPKKHYIGIMSGTSLDGIDTVLTEITSEHCTVIAHHACEFPANLKKELQSLCSPTNNEIQRLGVAEAKLAKCYADAVNALLHQQQFPFQDIAAIGCHGQTLRHHPELGFSLQANNPAALAAYTNIPVVADFRRGDIALGGQGAPLVPKFHLHQFGKIGAHRAILNLGGIANISLLTGQTLSLGFDTGPANLLLDAWCLRHTQKPYDNKGAWARSGRLLPELLQRLLTDAYFSLPAPKSTGREHFNMAWLETHLTGNENPQDVQHTLAHLTAKTVADSLSVYKVDEVIACGGGAHNSFTLELLAHYLPTSHVVTSNKYGIAPEQVEAAAFAWLAWARVNNVSGNAREATGASRELALGGLYLP